ncbi:MAG: carboxylating nicotinate-nucleotide diphosphorylase [Deltaproteobacteria bacterium]|nr:carboxylating nicotinate-nucleotide diphosphorylase [Deltaproteobacteria bacterium]
MLEETEAVQALLDLAFREDVGPGDITTDAVVPEDARATARLVAKTQPALVLYGLKVFAEVFRRQDDTVWVELLAKDGDLVPAGTVVANINGPARSMLTAERLALNLLMRLSGVATSTRAMKMVLKDHPTVKLLDTRKTTPGLRALERAAVRAGGGTNHRYGLADGVLIKDNHVAVAGGVKNAIQRARAHVHHLIRIECEVSDLPGVKDALEAGADAILLDNMDAAAMREAVVLVRGQPRPVFVEASGNMTMKRLVEVASTGVDGISVGAITHSAPAVDFSLEFTPAPAT